MSRIALIGAGVTGITTAYELLRRDHEVWVFDLHDAAAMETSFANGGQISASNAEVWNNGHSILLAMRALFRRDAPIRINPTPDWHKVSWFQAFLKAGFRRHENTVELARMALHGRDALRAIAARENIPFDMNDSGLLHVYRTKRQFDIANKANALLTRCGLKRYPVTADEIRTIEPALRGTFHAGLYSPDDFGGDVHMFTRGLFEVCRQRGLHGRLGRAVTGLRATAHGVHVRHRSGVAGGDPETVGEDFDKIVICAGVASRGLARMLDDDVNIYPVKGYSLTVDLDLPAEAAHAPRTCLLDEEAKIVTSTLGHRLRIAGLAEFNGPDKSIDPTRVDVLSQWCRSRFPGLSQKTTLAWTGLRPMMPRMVPTVGQGRHPGVFYNTGHGHLGWTLSAGTALDIARLIEAPPHGS